MIRLREHSVPRSRVHTASGRALWDVYGGHSGQCPGLGCLALWCSSRVEGIYYLCAMEGYLPILYLILLCVRYCPVCPVYCPGLSGTVRDCPGLSGTVRDCPGLSGTAQCCPICNLYRYVSPVQVHGPMVMSRVQCVLRYNTAYFKARFGSNQETPAPDFAPVCADFAPILRTSRILSQPASF